MKLVLRQSYTAHIVTEGEDEFPLPMYTWHLVVTYTPSVPQSRAPVPEKGQELRSAQNEARVYEVRDLKLWLDLVSLAPSGCQPCHTKACALFPFIVSKSSRSD